MCSCPAGDFLKTLQDPDLNVRRVALALFNSAAHNKPSLIRDLLGAVLPSLYNETKVRRELIREVCPGLAATRCRDTEVTPSPHLLTGDSCIYRFCLVEGRNGAFQAHGG